MNRSAFPPELLPIFHSLLFLPILTFAVSAQEDSVRVAQQNPSPMVESTRTHDRVKQGDYPGVRFEVSGVLPQPVRVFIPKRSLAAGSVDLLIHFHGGGYVVDYAAFKCRRPLIAAYANLGSGSEEYNDAFADTTIFPLLVDSIVARRASQFRRSIKVRRVILSGFSAGYGAIRKIISTEENYRRVDAVLLLDGLHTSYLPERRVLAEGGRIDSSGLLPYLRLAEDACGKRSAKRFLITHSEIFPGTFVSTTEATDWLLRKAGLRRSPVLSWGPLGMQRLSEARRGRFAVLGFAGNTAPDHIDHLHSMYRFLNDLMNL